MKVQILIDNKTSWIVPYAEELVGKIQDVGHEASLFHNHEQIGKGDILCLLSCEKLFKNLALNTHNLVVHESALPKGKGWSPVSWQVLEGSKRIPVTLFEAVNAVDAGQIYGQTFIELEGDELWPEIKDKQGRATQQLIMEFIQHYPNVVGKEQQGESTYYPRRTASDSELDVDKSIREQFNLLRICDNERYPAYFSLNGKKYFIKVFRGTQEV